MLLGEGVIGPYIFTVIQTNEIQPFIFRVPPDIFSLQLSTPKIVGA
jgi:hypothetical protein